MIIGLEVAKNFKPSKWQQRQQQQQQQKQAFGRIVWAFSLEKFKQTLCSLSHSVFCTIWLFFSLFVNVCYRWNIEWIEWREKYAFQSLLYSFHNRRFLSGPEERFLLDLRSRMIMITLKKIERCFGSSSATNSILVMIHSICLVLEVYSIWSI